MLGALKLPGESWLYVPPELFTAASKASLRACHVSPNPAELGNEEPFQTPVAVQGIQGRRAAGQEPSDRPLQSNSTTEGQLHRGIPRVQAGF